MNARRAPRDILGRMTVLDLGPSRALDLRDGRLTTPDGVDHLTDIELRLVRYLVERAGAAVGRDELEVAVWGYRPGVMSRTVFTTIGRVRQKLEVDPHAPTHLVTVAGRGYQWASAPRAEVRPALPVALTPLVGRQELVDRVVASLAAASLVSLTGQGGAGKTRVAIEVLRRWSGSAVFVALEPLDRAGAVPEAIAAALGVRLGGRSDPWGELADSTDGPVLVALDNAEHLVGLAEPLSRWLGACPTLRLLVTTRVRLGLRAEVSHAVPPLTVPLSGTTLSSSEAGALLLQHAGRARPGWVPGGADADALAALCRQVGGNPLALELAAAWLRVLEPSEVLEEVASGAVLVSRDHDLPERHRSIDAALGASWRLLAADAARALEDVSACCGAFDRATAGAVAAMDLGALSQLVDASLVHRCPADGAAARFDLHPLVREHARARLRARPDAAAPASRHAAWFLGRLVDTVGAMDALGEDVVRRSLAPDHEDVLAAWSERCRAGDAAALARAAWPLYRWLDAGNRFVELEAALREAGDALGDSPTGRAIAVLGAGAGVGPLVAAWVDVAAGGELGTAATIHAAIAAQRGGDLGATEVLATRALEGGASTFLTAFARSVRGSARTWAGRFGDAEDDLRAALASCPSGRGHARPAVHLGELLLRSGRAPEARDQLETALAACRATDDRAFACLALSRLAEALRSVGGDPDAVCVEAIEEGVGSRLPRVWWSGAVALLGDRWLGERPEVGVTLLSAAAHGPVMGPREPLSAALQASRGRLAPEVWARAEQGGRRATDLELLRLVRG